MLVRCYKNFSIDTVKNDNTTEISEKGGEDFRSWHGSSADKSRHGSDHDANSTLMVNRFSSLPIPGSKKRHVVDEISETTVGLQKIIPGVAKKNHTKQTGVVKRKKRCLFELMTLGGIASMAADL